MGKTIKTMGDRLNRLCFYYGVMGSAKTTQLLTTNFALKQHERTVILSPEIDSRKEKGKIKSRAGIEASCLEFSVEDDLDAGFGNYLSAKHSILVDEAQFLKKEQADQLAALVDRRGFDVICYGLKTDFRGELFEGSKRLLELADKIEEIKTNCSCGRKATMNAHLINNKVTREGPQILIGDTVGDIKYKAMCRKCWQQI